MTGTGTSSDPYIVYTMDEFVSKISEADKYIELGDDLDCMDWQPATATTQYTFGCRQIDGKDHIIKNLHLDSTTYTIGYLFKLNPANQNAVMKNVKWYNIRLTGCTLFNMGPRYAYRWDFNDCEFQMFLHYGIFLSDDYTPCRFKNCSVYIESEASSNPIITDYYSSTSYIWDSCNIEINGICGTSIIQGQFVNCLITGNVEITPNYGTPVPIEFYNAGDYSYANSILDMTIINKSSIYPQYQIYNRGSYASGILINTDKLEGEYELTGTTSAFIQCTTSRLVYENQTQKNDNITWLRQQGFDVEEIPTNFVWHDWLMNGNDVRVSQLDYSAGGTFNFTVDGTNNTFSSDVTLASKTYCLSQPFADSQWYTYYFSAESGHSYRIVATGAMPENAIPFLTFYRNGSSWMNQLITWEGIIRAVDSTSSISVQLGARNLTDETVSGTFEYTNVEIYKHSDWVFSGFPAGKLTHINTRDVRVLGAFAYASKLKEVNIPVSALSIGRYAFAYSGLKKATLPANCTYYETSFPADCVITGGSLIN